MKFSLHSLETSKIFEKTIAEIYQLEYHFGHFNKWGSYIPFCIIFPLGEIGLLYLKNCFFNSQFAIQIF